MNVGDHVELYVKYTDRWSGGFEIAAVVEGGYQVRRVSDAMLLPAPTSPSDIRPAEAM